MTTNLRTRWLVSDKFMRRAAIGPSATRRMAERNAADHLRQEAARHGLTLVGEPVGKWAEEMSPGEPSKPYHAYYLTWTASEPG